jgi:hypothetical protein
MVLMIPKINSTNHVVVVIQTHRQGTEAESEFLIFIYECRVWGARFKRAVITSIHVFQSVKKQLDIRRRGRGTARG